MTIDHIIPKSKGGISSFKNCICACKRCNTKKGDLSSEEYLYYYEPIAGRGMLQNQQLEQKIHYIQQLLETINEQTIYDQYRVRKTSAEQVLQKIEQVELRIKQIKENVEKVFGSELFGSELLLR
ncbi:hypothetical protein GRQ40_12650 [Anoxybacillus sp. PDR2]|nr:hypothetical protein GRQ40_12650 [Anoxybacillus sp. PDR2]